MDIEKLISLVFENRCLWDMKGKNYHNRDLARQKWEYISQEMDNNLEAVKNKWRGLRDTFRKEWNKLPKKRSGQEGGVAKESTWPYFKSMMFLKDQFLPRKLHSSVREDEIHSEIDDQEFEELVEDEPNSETNSIQDESRESQRKVAQSENNSISENFAAPQAKRAKNTEVNVIEKLLNIEQHKLEQFKQKVELSNKEKNKEDADYHFMMSLLPFLRKVPVERKLFVRTKLQQVFCDEETVGQQHQPDYGTSSSRSQRTCYYSNPSTGNSPHHSWESYSSSPTQLTVLTTAPQPSCNENAIQHNASEGLVSYFSTHNPNNN